MTEVRITAGFEEDLQRVTSDTVLENILHTLVALKTIPSMGSGNSPHSFEYLFGENVHKIPVNPFIIITRYHEQENIVEVLGLMHQRETW